MSHSVSASFSTPANNASRRKPRAADVTFLGPTIPCNLASTRSCLTGETSDARCFRAKNSLLPFGENFAGQSSRPRRRLSCTWSPVAASTHFSTRRARVSAFPSFEKLHAAQNGRREILSPSSKIAESCSTRRNEQSTQEQEGNSNLTKKFPREVF